MAKCECGGELVTLLDDDGAMVLVCAACGKERDE